MKEVWLLYQCQGEDRTKIRELVDVFSSQEKAYEIYTQREKLPLWGYDEIERREVKE